MAGRESDTAASETPAAVVGRHEAWIGLGLCLLAVAYRLVMVHVDRFDTDEGEHLSVAYAALSGRPIYCQVYWVFPPLSWQVLVPIIMTFGETVRTIVAARLFSVLISAATMWQLWLLGRTLYGSRGAWAMPLLFTLTSYAASTGAEVRPDNLHLLLLVVSVRCIVPLGLDSPIWRFLAAGAVMAAATLFKQYAFVYGAYIALFFVWHTWPQWRVDSRTARRAALVALAAVAPAIAAWLLARHLSGCPSFFVHLTLSGSPHLHQEGEKSYIPLMLGFLLNPAMSAAMLGAAVIVAVHALKTRRLSTGAKLTIVAFLPAVQLSLRARPFSEHYFLLIGLFFALLGGAGVHALDAWRPRLARVATYVVVGLLAVNAAAFTVYTTRYTPSGRFFDPRPADEFFDRQMKTIDFVLRNTPHGAPVLGSNPLWCFRPGGIMNPANITMPMLEEMTYPWSSQELRSRIVPDFLRQPAVFVMIDGWMVEIMRRYPAIDAHIRANFEIVMFGPGHALLGVSRALGGHVPRDDLKPASL